MTVPGLPRFTGGLVGYLGYDAVRHLERLPSTARTDLDLPDALFLLTDTLLIFDNVTHRITVVSNAFVRDDERIRDRAGLPGIAAEDRRHHRRPAAPGRRPGRCRGTVCGRGARLDLHPAGLLRCGATGQGLHPGGRYHPGGALAATGGPDGRRPLRRLPGAPRRESVPVHVLPAAGGPQDRRQLARDAGPAGGRAHRSPAHRGHATARGDGGRGSTTGGGVARRPEGARRAHHAGGPGPKRRRERSRGPAA